MKKIHRYKTIKIDLETNRKKTDKSSWESKDEFWHITVLDGHSRDRGGVAWGLKASKNRGKDLQKILKQIKEHL